MKIKIAIYNKRILSILVGQFIATVAFSLILIPNLLSPTGFGGIATTLWHLWGWNVQMVMLLLAVPVIIWALFKYDRNQIYYALTAYLTFTAYSAILPRFIPAFHTDAFIAALLGGGLLGLGTGLVLRMGVSNGPEAIVGLYVNGKYGISLGNYNLLLNTLIIFTSVVYGGLTLIIYSIFCNYVCSIVTDLVILGNKKYYVANIMTERFLDMAQYVQSEMNRGVSFVQCVDTDSVKKKMMVKVVVNSHELAHMKDYIKATDPEAFIYIVNSTELYGKGF